VADSGPFYSGPTHSQDFSRVFDELVNFPVFVPENGQQVLGCYDLALQSNRPSMIVEKKSFL
jgi:pyruvate/2-oxoglutarate/acetoin dehydrogenase E1 component